MKTNILALLFILFFQYVSFGQFTSKKELRTVANEMIDLIKNQSLVRDSIDWAQFKGQINLEINSIQNIDSVDFIIDTIINKLRQCGDHHSFYYSKSITKKSGIKNETIPLPTSKLVNNNIGYLSLPTHFTQNKEFNYLYADTLRKQIQFLDENNEVIGWVIDLRENRGGNMWPMIAGLNPLIKDNTVGYFVHSRYKTKWKSASKKPQYLQEMNNTYKCKNLRNNIAVLIDTLTASSGEMTAISFLGMKNTKSFGNETAGYTTANSTHKLSNGAYLFLASSYCMDRNKKVYRGKIQPEIKVANSVTLNEAIKWIKNH